MAPGGISVENLELRREDFYSQLEGNYNGNDFRLSGFAFADTSFKEGGHQEPALNALAGNRLAGADLFILDIDCRGNFTFPELRLDRLNFTLNNNPISLRGDILFSDPLVLDLAVSSYLKYPKYEQPKDIKTVDLKIKGVLREGVFSADGIINIDSLKKEKGGFPLERFELGFNGLTFYFSQYLQLKMHLMGANLFLRTDQNEYKVPLKGLNAVFYLRNKKIKFVKFDSLFYDGFLRGQGKIDITRWPPVITSLARIDNTSVNKLDSLLIHFSKFRGKLASRMYFTSFPHLLLKGNMVIDKGYLYNLEFFKWLADFFDLPALKKIYFKRAASSFIVDEKGAGLGDMRLESKDTNLNGFFNLGHNDIVSSKISLVFTRKLLRESKKFTPLLKLLGKDVNNLPFDFQLSGNLHKMNFQWLQSDFKRKIQASIPNFIERKIDRDVEKIIESFSSQD